VDCQASARIFRIIFKSAPSQVTGAKTLNTLVASTLGKAQVRGEYLLKRSGLSMARAIGAHRSNPTPSSKLESHVQPLSWIRSANPCMGSGLQASVCNLTRPAGAQSELRHELQRCAGIAPNYLSTEDDRRIVRKASTGPRHCIPEALARYHPRNGSRGFISGPSRAVEAGRDIARQFSTRLEPQNGKTDDPWRCSTASFGSGVYGPAGRRCRHHADDTSGQY